MERWQENYPDRPHPPLSKPKPPSPAPSPRPQTVIMVQSDAQAQLMAKAVELMILVSSVWGPNPAKTFVCFRSYRTICPIKPPISHQEHWRGAEQPGHCCERRNCQPPHGGRSAQCEVRGEAVAVPGRYHKPSTLNPSRPLHCLPFRLSWTVSSTSSRVAQDPPMSHQPRLRLS